jgi:Zn-dependent M16 (insulinase) family peptidase
MFEGPNSLFYGDLIEQGLAPNYCPGYGYDFTTKQSTFTIGVQGILQEDADKIEKKIQESLTRASNEGFEEHLFETVLH